MLFGFRHLTCCKVHWYNTDFIESFDGQKSGWLYECLRKFCRFFFKILCIICIQSYRCSYIYIYSYIYMNKYIDRKWKAYIQKKLPFICHMLNHREFCKMSVSQASISTGIYHLQIYLKTCTQRTKYCAFGVSIQSPIYKAMWREHRDISKIWDNNLKMNHSEIGWRFGSNVAERHVD